MFLSVSPGCDWLTGMEGYDPDDGEKEDDDDAVKWAEEMGMECC